MERSGRLFARNGVGHRTVTLGRTGVTRVVHRCCSGPGYDAVTDLLLALCSGFRKFSFRRSDNRLTTGAKELFLFLFRQARVYLVVSRNGKERDRVKKRLSVAAVPILLGTLA